MHQLRLPIAALTSLALAACAAAPTPSLTVPGTPATTPSPTVTPDGSPAEPTPTDAASPSPSPTGESVLGDALECENEELGYEVDYPEEWWGNERIEPEDDNLTPIAACQYFAPSEVELQPNAGLPNGIAIRLEIPSEEIDPPEDEILSDDETTVADHDARVVEIEPAPQAGFVPEGSRIYRYIIELDDGRQLVATTDDILQDDARYEESKPILDAMMATLEIED